MPGDFDGDVPPLRIPEVERVVVDVGHRFFPLQVAPATYFPDRGLGLGDQNQKQPRLAAMAGQILFRDLVLPLAPLALNDRNTRALAKARRRRLKRPAIRMR
jgi:hypothetical protein